MKCTPGIGLPSIERQSGSYLKFACLHTYSQNACVAFTASLYYDVLVASCSAAAVCNACVENRDFE